MTASSSSPTTSAIALGAARRGVARARARLPVAPRAAAVAPSPSSSSTRWSLRLAPEHRAGVASARLSATTSKTMTTTKTTTTKTTPARVVVVARADAAASSDAPTSSLADDDAAIDWTALGRYFAATAAQCALLVWFTLWLNGGLNNSGLPMKYQNVIVFVWFAFNALKSRTFSPLNASRPKLADERAAKVEARRTGPHTTAFALCTPILKDFALRVSPPTPRFQSPPLAFNPHPRCLSTPSDAPFDSAFRLNSESVRRGCRRGSRSRSSGPPSRSSAPRLASSSSTRSAGR